MAPTDGEGPYRVIVSLERAEVSIKSFGSMTEAILYTFEVELLVARAGFKVPPMRVEMRGER